MNALNKTTPMILNSTEKKGFNREAQILNGEYTASEARDVISKIIDDQINFCKTQFMSHYEGNHEVGTDYYEKKIADLNYKKQEFKESLSRAKKEGLKISLEGSIKLKFEKN